MFTSKHTAQKLLDIEENIPLHPRDMAQSLNVTFFPRIGKGISNATLDFAEELKKAFKELGVTILPYEDVLIRPPFFKIVKWYFFAIVDSFYASIKNFLKMPIGDQSGHALLALRQMRRGKRIRKGVSVIAVGEGETGNLPMDHTMSFRESSVITILDMPEQISRQTDFLTHFDTAIRLFAHHMTNIVIGVNKEDWLLYNFNASHPIYPRDENLAQQLLFSLIPKIAAPISPPRLSEFTIERTILDPEDSQYKPFVEDLVESGFLLEKTGLYPPGKSIEALPFRNDLYRWIGKIHLDHRNGMSYGFLARQLPTHISIPITSQEFKHSYPSAVEEDASLFRVGSKRFLAISIPGSDQVYVQIPDIWVLSQRSGSDKTHFNPSRDLVKLGLVDGNMVLQFPKEVNLKEGYRPSYDTKVILAHALGNAIIASLLLHLAPGHVFSKQIQNSGSAIAHWHGYIQKSSIPMGWYVYGAENPHVACSTPQSAVYAFEGKIANFLKFVEAAQKDYKGDVHIEPHHGVNVTFPSLKELGKFLIDHPDATKLGNSYLDTYF